MALNQLVFFPKKMVLKKFNCLMRTILNNNYKKLSWNTRNQIVHIQILWIRRCGKRIQVIEKQ